MNFQHTFILTRVVSAFFVISSPLRGCSTSAIEDTDWRPTRGIFLVRASPEYMGSILSFLLDERQTGRFVRLTDVVRDGLST